MDHKRILTIQDISCHGKCSMTVALPILSVCGHETCILPSAVLSTHTGGFSKPTFRDLTEDIPAITRHWQQEGILFDCIYTGYLGSTRQIDYVIHILDTLGRPGCTVIVDPAMADHGKLYAGFDKAYADAMKTLCARADVVLPNLTEACLLTGTEYREDTPFSQLPELTGKLHALGIPNVVLTGIGTCPEETGSLVSTPEGVTHCPHPRLLRSYHGTGDCFAAALTGSVLRGKTLAQAAQIAGEFVYTGIAKTIGDDSHWYGIRFEEALPQLLAALQ